MTTTTVPMQSSTGRRSLRAAATGALALTLMAGAFIAGRADERSSTRASGPQSTAVATAGADAAQLCLPDGAPIRHC